MEVNELFKQRSITACMKASYNTVTSDIKSFVKQTWATHVPFRGIAGYRTLLSPPQQVASRLGSSKSDGIIHPANHHLLSHHRHGSQYSFWYLLPTKAALS